MTNKIVLLAGWMFTLIFMSSCATTPHELEAGDSILVIQVIPEPYGRWETAKVYLNGQFVDTAVPGNDQKTYDLAPGKYDIKVITDGYETCEESVTLIDGQKKQYVELRPKKVLRSPLSKSIQRFFGN